MMSLKNAEILYGEEDEVLSRRSESVVYSTTKRMVVKRMKSYFSDSSTFFEMILPLSFRSENLINPVSFIDGKLCYMFMENEGRPIYAFKSTKIFRKKVIYQTLLAVNYLHYNHILHMDIKPENILYKMGKVKLIDMGISVVKGIKIYDNAVLCTLWYRPPEGLKHNQYDHLTDSWSIGATMLSLINEKCLRGSSETDQLKRIERLLDGDLDKILSVVDEDEAGFVKCAFASRENRYTVKQLLNHSYFDDVRNRQEVLKHSVIKLKIPSNPNLLVKSLQKILTTHSLLDVSKESRFFIYCCSILLAESEGAKNAVIISCHLASCVCFDVYFKRDKKIFKNFLVKNQYDILDILRSTMVLLNSIFIRLKK